MEVKGERSNKQCKASKFSAQGHERFKEKPDAK